MISFCIVSLICILSCENKCFKTQIFVDIIYRHDKQVPLEECYQILVSSKGVVCAISLEAESLSLEAESLSVLAVSCHKNGHCNILKSTPIFNLIKGHGPWGNSVYKGMPHGAILSIRAWPMGQFCPLHTHSQYHTGQWTIVTIVTHQIMCTQST